MTVTSPKRTSPACESVTSPTSPEVRPSAARSETSSQTTAPSSVTVYFSLSADSPRRKKVDGLRAGTDCVQSVAERTPCLMRKSSTLLATTSMWAV